MIKYSDVTLNECIGDFLCVSQKMGDIPVWMLKSRMSTITNGMGFNYTIHFWNTGRAVIMQTDRPLGLEVPDDDLHELSQWCKSRGWVGLYVSDRLLSDPQEHDFWFRMFRSGVINSDMLKQKEEDEMHRMANSIVNDEQEID